MLFSTLALANAPLFNDPGWGSMWITRDSAQYGISLKKAYEQFGHLPSKELIVAIIDTGVDYNHEDLRDVMWVNTKEIPGNGIDDDNNGYIDDVHGVNLLEKNGDPMDDHLHGTLSAGIIAAKHNNNIGLVGIAPNVKIMAIRAIPSDRDETDEDVAEALLYAAKNGAKVINCSFGKRSATASELVYNTIKKIGEQYGALIVTASGNFSENIEKIPFYPASFKNENLIVTTAINREGGLAHFASHGSLSVDVAAPGVDIYSTVLNHQYGFYFGTSMATPVLTGTIAHVWSKFPTLDGLQIKQVILDSVKKNKKLIGKTLTGGHIDLNAALTKAQNYLQFTPIASTSL